MKKFYFQKKIILVASFGALLFARKLSIAPILSDFFNAFASVPHQRLLLKLAFYAIHCHTLTWIEHFSNKSHITHSLQYLAGANLGYAVLLLASPKDLF